MHAIFAFFALSTTPTAMCSAGIAIFLIGLWAARNDIAGARGLDEIVALSNLCFAIPLGVFGALHLSDAGSLVPGVPRYMPWRMFWVYFVGFALVAASLSIASKLQVRWSGLLVGITMFLFEAMIHIPKVVANPHDRFALTVVFREASFGGAAWLLAGSAKNGWPPRVKSTLTTVGRILVVATAIFFGIEHFLHPLGLPGVPLKREMPVWVPGRAVIDYITGAALIIAAASILLNRKARTVAACAGGWILLTILVIYLPMMIGALADPATDVKILGINYFFDTLLFTGAILAAASAAPTSAGMEKKAATSSS